MSQSLYASSHLYLLSVRPSVQPIVRPSVHLPECLSVGLLRLCEIHIYQLFFPRRDSVLNQIMESRVLEAFLNIVPEIQAVCLFIRLFLHVLNTISAKFNSMQSHI